MSEATTMSENKVKSILPKKRGRRKKYTGDYTEEYKKHLRCPICKHPTKGKDDYKNIRSGNITKSCMKCRERVYKSYKKVSRKPTQKETIKALYDIIKKLESVNTLKEKFKDDETLLPFIQPIVEVQ